MKAAPLQRMGRGLEAMGIKRVLKEPEMPSLEMRKQEFPQGFLRWFLLWKLGETARRQMLAAPEEKPPPRCRL